MKMKLVAIFSLVLFTGCSSSSSPNLYSPVLPLEDGSLFTSTTAESKDKSLVRATRNAERYCKHQNSSYIVISMKSMYEGLLPDEAAANKAEKGSAIASKLSLGILSPGTATDYRVELAFRCVENKGLEP